MNRYVNLNGYVIELGRVRCSLCMCTHLVLQGVGGHWIFEERHFQLFSNGFKSMVAN